MLIFISLFAVVCYAIASWLQWQRATGRRLDVRPTVLLLGIAGFAVHGISVYHTLHHPAGIDLGLFSMGSLISWLVTALVIGSSLRQRIDNLFIGVFPMAAVTVLLASLMPTSEVLKPYGSGMFLHILLSVLAYSIFTLATLQALLLWRQQLALKQHHTRGLVASLPPLQIMEKLLFEMLWVGFILLSISLISGWLFVDNLFAQHLVHKTLLSLAAWLIYATLLGGRQIMGWRGMTAIRWTIGGFLLLMLGFFGSKLVLEFIL
ncbi:CcsA-related protein [Nitrincola lacisaponensis]|uniref:CcsA-related protein n=1 Tax=Nitrincola lacisaponensis TaxID=267850 RepID=A0A063Y587_9GAMM|nr:cytochrome c biogenesis protein CcsA [Nitrincola lacisaponensis]KDE40320.1 CcsA-related protein [Nitrincola lacisaponensis]